MQHKYSNIQKLEVELKQLEDPIDLPNRPRELLMNSVFFLNYFTFIQA